MLAYGICGGRIADRLDDASAGRESEYKVEFLREDALDSNVMESLFKQIIPNFVNKGVIK